MAIKRKQPLEDDAADMDKKRLKRNLVQEHVEAYVDKMKTRKLNKQVEANDVDMNKNVTTTSDDRISDLPDFLRLHILSFLDAKQAVRTSVLSKQWVSSWKSVHILSFTQSGFIKSFDKLVNMALSARDHSVKLERLAFNRGQASSNKILKTILDYTIKHGVKEVELHISSMNRKNKHTEWPIGLRDNKLRSLKLQSSELVDCAFLGPRSGSFKNLTALYLRRAIIKHPDPFSGFPMLEKLTLLDFVLNEDLGDILNVRGLQLSELTIASHTMINQCVLATPKLRFFEYVGSKFPVLKIHQGGGPGGPGGLPILDTVVVDYRGFRYSNQMNKLFEELMNFFGVVYNAKSLKVLSAVTELLWMFGGELMRRYSPFLNLKGLTMDFSPYYNQNLFETKCPSFELFEVVAVPYVKDYLLKNSPEAKFSKIYPKKLI